MSTRTTKTIDDLGVQTYVKYEADRGHFDDKILFHASQVASELSRDISEPLLLSEFQTLFDLSKRSLLWGDMAAPKHYNDQRRRLFTHQLAPKLGPEELLEAQIDRIEQMRDRERDEREKKRDKGKFAWETDQESEQISKEAAQLIQLMQDINLFNKMVEHINRERYRYSKG